MKYKIIAIIGWFLLALIHSVEGRDEAEHRRIKTDEAEQAVNNATLMLSTLVSDEPKLLEFAESNVEVSTELLSWSQTLDDLDGQLDPILKQISRIEADYEDTKYVLDHHGLSEGLGRMLLLDRQALPVYEGRKEREEAIAQVGVKQHTYRNELRELEDADHLADRYLTAHGIDRTSDVLGELHKLFDNRRELLIMTHEVGQVYLDKLTEINAEEKRLVEIAENYRALLDENLLWLRNEDAVRWSDMVQVSHEFKSIFSVTHWKEIGSSIFHGFIRMPLCWISLVAIGVLYAKRRKYRTLLKTTSEVLGRPRKDNFQATIQALWLTMMLALPTALIFATVGGILKYSVAAPLHIQTLGQSLVDMALYLWVLRFISCSCISDGLCEAHFRWSTSSITVMSKSFSRLIWAYLPLHLLMSLYEAFSPNELHGVTIRLAYVIYYLIISIFIFRLFRPGKGVLNEPVLNRKKGLLVKYYPLLFLLAVLFPLGLAAGMLLGYQYPALTLSEKYTNSIWLFAILVYAYGLAERWLSLTRSRLAYEAIQEKRKAAQVAQELKETETYSENETNVLQVDEQEVDFTALSDESRGLLRLVIYASAFIGLYLIWASLLPALGIFDNVILWQQSVTVGAEMSHVPITLADLARAVLYLVITIILSKRLPSLLEMVLMQRFHMSAGDRYTITSLTTYVIIATGVLSVLKSIGATWAQLQWLVAALGVGIGFGLQEIIANFISGLIILFERPIQVGDIVTVGDVDGVVTKIRIRATTIRTWERKELLVPNKDFVTGRLLNWSLTDNITRVTVSVGIAYGSDVEKALKLMRQAAVEHELISDEPAPVITFESFGDNALQLMLRAFTASLDNRLSTITDLHRTINQKFNEADIVIAFPQRDLHIDTAAPLRVHVEKHT